MEEDDEKAELKAKFDVLNGIYEDLPDGAWMAVMEENGFNAATIAWLHEDEES